MPRGKPTSPHWGIRAVGESPNWGRSLVLGLCRACGTPVCTRLGVERGMVCAHCYAGARCVTCGRSTGNRKTVSGKCMACYHAARRAKAPGMYYTPKAVIDTINTVDPGCGTGAFVTRIVKSARRARAATMTTGYVEVLQ
jgi:hypothetical protein